MSSAPECAERVRSAALSLSAGLRRRLRYQWFDRALRSHLVDAFIRIGWTIQAHELLGAGPITDRASLLTARARIATMRTPDLPPEPRFSHMEPLTSFFAFIALLDTLSTQTDDSDLFEASFGAIMAARFAGRGDEELQIQLIEVQDARTSMQ